MTGMAEAMNRLADAAGRQADALERQERREEDTNLAQYRSEPGRPRRLSFLSMARAVPGLLQQYATTVPAEFWALDGDAAVIACPCGAEPKAVHGRPTGCDCDRSYLYDGEVVRVAYARGQADTTHKV